MSKVNSVSTNAERDTPSDPMQPLNGLVSEKVTRILAKLGFPNGATGECVMCGKEREYTFEQVVRLLRKSLPRHCDKPIDLKPL
jgi:hypothetical protein